MRGKVQSCIAAFLRFAHFLIPFFGNSAYVRSLLFLLRHQFALRTLACEAAMCISSTDNKFVKSSGNMYSGSLSVATCFAAIPVVTTSLQSPYQPQNVEEPLTPND